MKIFLTFLALVIICILPMFPVYGDMQEKESSSGDGEALWQFDSGG